MDGVVFNYYGQFQKEWMIRHPDHPIIPGNELKDFYIENAYGAEHKEEILQITRSTSFFENLEPNEGAIEALQSILADERFDPALCSAPDLDYQNQHCPSEKYRSIERHLGREWLERTILTKDKTKVRGNYLIDDKPTIKGSMNPHWMHVVFTHRYNEHLDGLRLNGWKDWPRLRDQILYLETPDTTIA